MTDEIMQFPCDLPIKVFGRSGTDLENAAFDIVKAHFASLERADIRSQSSRQGRFISLTINIRADSREQVDAVYQDLSANDSILMVL